MATRSVTLSFAFIFLILLATRGPSDCTACTSSRSPPRAPAPATPLPARHFLNTSVARLVVSVRLLSQLVSHLGERFRITSPDSLHNSSARSHPACGATAADNAQTSHLQFPGAESSLHLTISAPLEANSSSMMALAPSRPSPTPRSPSGLTDMHHVCFLLMCQVTQLLMIPFIEPGSFLLQNGKCSKYSVGEGCLT